jgi:hypothetical protein
MKNSHRIGSAMSKAAGAIYETWSLPWSVSAVILTFVISCFFIWCRSHPRYEGVSPEAGYEAESRQIVTNENDDIPFLAMEATSKNSVIYQKIAARLAAESIVLEPAEYYHMILIFTVKRSDGERIRQILAEDARLREMLEPFISDDFKEK